MQLGKGLGRARTCWQCASWKMLSPPLMVAFRVTAKLIVKNLESLVSTLQLAQYFICTCCGLT